MQGLKNCRVSRSATLLKRDSSTDIFLWILCNFSKKHLQNTSGCLLLLIHLWQAKFYPLITPFLFFLHFSLNLWLKLWEFIQKGYKNEDLFTFFTIIYPKMIYLRQFHLSNNLLMHIREDTDLAKASAVAECQGKFRRVCINMLIKHITFKVIKRLYGIVVRQTTFSILHTFSAIH